MSQSERVAEFEQIVSPHFRAAFNLACWLTHSPHDAEDVVQEAYLRAFKFFDSFDGRNGRTWLLAIVRNTCFTWMQKNRRSKQQQVFDDSAPLPADAEAFSASVDAPDAALLRTADRQLLNAALQELPTEYREALVLRELEGLAYKEIAEVTQVPVGTVMSRLSRGRQLLQRTLIQKTRQDNQR